MRLFSRASIGFGLLFLGLVAGPVVSKPKYPEVNERLTQIFVDALTTSPEISFPDLQFPATATIEEKAKALAAHVISMAGAALDDFFGDYGELLHEIRIILKEKNKLSRRKQLLDAVQRIFYLLTQGRTSSQTCKEVKKAGRTPEARLGHSPTPLFGFPVFSPEFKTTILERRLPLNMINQHLVGIKVGAEDYVVQGHVHRVISFLDCFADYTVTAQTLFSDGHWYSEEHDGEKPRPVYLQIQGATSNGSLPELFVRQSLIDIVRLIDFNLAKQGTLTALVDEAFVGQLTPAEFMTTRSGGTAVRQLRAYARAKGQKFLGLVKQLQNAPTFKEKIEILNKFLSEDDPSPAGWTQAWAVQHQTRITLTITTYPRPDYNNKATFRMNSPTVTLGQIRDAIRRINWTNHF